MSTEFYENPLNTRYASDAMKAVFSDDTKFKLWRELWIALAKTEKELGLNITDEQISELEKNKDNINYDVAKEREKIVRHDVMSHVYAYGTQCPNAKGIIHLGATSCFVGDNADIIIIHRALKIVREKLLKAVSRLSDFALKYKDMPTLGFTHFQPAQLTTVGKRATLWIYDLLLDIEQVDFLISKIRLRGAKGTTGTQASFMELFKGDGEKVKTLDREVVKKMGYENEYPVTGQTYPRKFDSYVLNCLSGIAQSASKFANDIRLLQHLKEIEEPFEKTQIGSSAMAYKRNPMRSERITSLARFVITNATSPAVTAATQWFERTLDDSANKRITVPQSFLAVDAILDLYINVAGGLVVYPKVIHSRIMSELPFMATENIMMNAVKKGGDRQELHEKIRVYSMEAGRQVKEFGLPNDLISRIAKDPAFGLTEEEIFSHLKPEAYTGRAAGQVDDFINEYVKPLLKDAENLDTEEEIKV